ncbi:Serpentine receptor class alpha/beta-14 [Toxocara canis]|uniref:Serpentine receptor class alpha/beta-14 n=1 Tax=Toxocara canis TaxID=6265 RepID=A0A0B2W290_TOXCA|nr:Serpentine receptor class alpha/beta-14 [Toxocara canis]
MNRSEYLVEIRYQESDLARFIIGIQVLLSLLALIVTPMTMAAVLKSTLHVNARILLTSELFSAVMAAIGAIFLPIHDFYTLTFYSNTLANAHHLLYSRHFCLKMNSVFDIAGIACASGTLLIALERTIATFLYRTYETKSHAWIGYLLMSIPWFLGSSVWVLNLTTTEEESLVNTCDLQPAPMNELILCTFLTTQIITLLLFTIICILNRRKLTRQEGIYQRLAAIYQLKENINTTALMLPIALINAALYAVHVVAIAFFDRLFSEALSVSETNLLIVRARLVHYAYLLKSTTAIFALCISFIVVRQNYSIRKIIFKWLHMKTRINVVEPSPLDGGYVYFRALQEQWALAAR